MNKHVRAASVTAVVVAVVLLACCGAAFDWRASGGRWFVVQTASMGQAAPVGTLLLTRPRSVSDIRVGDIVTFRAPRTGEVYSHRVVAKAADGLRTRGDINSAPDPWTVTDADVIGRVAHRWWGFGWILRGLPLLLLCLAIVWLAAAASPLSWRSPMRVVGAAVSASIVALVLHPWVGLQRLGADVVTHGVVIRAVSTGILPVRAQAYGDGDSVRLVDGQVGAVTVTTTDEHGAYLLSATPSLTLWWWVVVILICLAPMLWCLAVGLSAVPAPVSAAVSAEDSTEDSAPEDQDVGLPLLLGRSAESRGDGPR